MADFPDFRVCLVAEQIRQEIGNKVTILGFSGISPTVRMIVPATPAAINVSFLFIFGPADHEGFEPAEMEVAGPEGLMLERRATPEPLKVNSRGTAALALGLQGMPVTQPGIYTVSVFIRNRKFDASFTVGVEPTNK